MTLDDLNKRFLWTRDTFDSWRIMTGAARLEGDCDDYAVTALYALTGSMLKFWWWILSFKAVFWLCRTDTKVLHCVLWIRGSGWIDNTTRYFSPDCKHTRIMPYLLPIVILKMIFGKFIK